jgi:hypothetical protein
MALRSTPLKVDCSAVSAEQAGKAHLDAGAAGVRLGIDEHIRQRLPAGHRLHGRALDHHRSEVVRKLEVARPGIVGRIDLLQAHHLV